MIADIDIESECIRFAGVLRNDIWVSYVPCDDSAECSDGVVVVGIVYRYCSTTRFSCLCLFLFTAAHVFTRPLVCNLFFSLRTHHISIIRELGGY